MKANLLIVLSALILQMPLMVRADTTDTTYKRAFTLSAGGGTGIEFKNYSPSGDSALLLSLTVRQWTNDSEVSSYNSGLGQTLYYQREQKGMEYGVGLGWRKLLTQSTFNTFFDSNLVFSFNRTIENYSNAPDEYKEYQKGVDLYFMYGAEYKFSKIFAMEGSFGVMLNAIRSDATGYRGGDTNSFSTTNSGVRVSFYF